MHSNFVPSVWPEDVPPNEALRYSQCELCTSKSRLIWGEGNPKAPVVVVLDNPGAREDRDGKEYVCGTRRTLQAALHDADLPAACIYLTYLLKCRPLRKYNKEEVRAFSKPFLIRQIEEMNPSFLVCLGDVVVQTLFDCEDAHVKNLRGEWHTVLGRSAIVSYHPLAVRRRPNLLPLFLEDLRKLARALHTLEKA